MDSDAAFRPAGADRIDDAMREAVGRLSAHQPKEEDYLRTSFILVRLLQNIISFPKDERYRTLRRTAPVSPQLHVEVLREVVLKQ